MTTDITKLAQDWKTAAHKAKQANDLYLEGKITLSECVVETKDYLDYSDNPNNILVLVEALEKAQQRIAELESRTVKLPEPEQWDITQVLLCKKKVVAAIRAAGIKVEAE